MQYLPVSSAKWDQKEKHKFKTTQNLGPKYINTFTGQSQSPPKNTRYRKAQRSESYPKQMLIILPNVVDNRIVDASSLSKELIRPNFIERVDSLPHNYQRIQQQSESKAPPINYKQYHYSKRNIINRLSHKQEDEFIQSPSPIHITKKMDPVIAKNGPRTKQQQKKVNSYYDLSWKLLKNARRTKQIFLIKKNIHNTSKARIFYESQDKYYRIGEEKNLSNVFNIHSFDKSYNSHLLDKPTKTFKEHRRSTQPNLDTEISLQKIPAIEQKSLMYYLEVKTCERIDTNDTPDEESSIKPRHSKVKLKDLSPIRHVKKIIKSTKPFIIPYESFYYRDFLWKINFSNEMYVEPPLQYQHRLKVYIGKGNNSCMIRGLINRRYWFAITDRIEQANFLWTQLKDLQYFKIQRISKNQLKKLESEGSYIENSLLTASDVEKYKKYWERYIKFQQNGDERLLQRLKHFKYSTIIKADEIRNGRMHNHLKNNYVIGNKKALFKSMSNYYQKLDMNPFDFVPLTFHCSGGLEDPVFLSFQKFYHRKNRQIRKSGEKKLNMWIIKPGENTNRGNGIKVCHDLTQIKEIVRNKDRWADGSYKTFIIQSYIQRPFLYRRRKIDIRHFIVITCINGIRKGYWYRDGYIRTTSSEYSLDSGSHSIHLTNDAIQKFLPDYGKYEKGNKLSYDHIDKYIKRCRPGKSFYGDVYPKMKRMALDIIKANINYLDDDRLENNFEIFGLDFMLDSQLKLWLIQANSNPCLELSCPLLTQIIPNLVENVLQISLDVMYPPPIRYCPKFPRYLTNMEASSRLQLMFDQRIEDGSSGDSELLENKMLYEQDQIFENDGSEWQQD